MDEKSRSSSISGIALACLIGGVFFALLSVLTHSKIDSASSVFYHSTLLCSAVVFIQVLPKWIYAMFFEIWALFFVFLIGLFQIKRIVEPRRGSGNETPVLLIHGFCNDAGVWFYFRSKLAKFYKGPIFAISLKSAFHPIEEHALTLKKRVLEVMQECRSEKIILIGHSMGGLVASLYALEHAPKDSIQMLITIATPFHGSYAAYLAPGRNGRQMRYGSVFTQTLSKRLEESALPIYQIRTLTDELVIPASSACIKQEIERNFIVENVGHAAMLFSSTVVKQVINWLVSI